jgi:hypothetical protein
MSRAASARAASLSIADAIRAATINPKILKFVTSSGGCATPTMREAQEPGCLSPVTEGSRFEVSRETFLERKSALPRNALTAHAIREAA